MSSAEDGRDRVRKSSQGTAKPADSALPRHVGELLGVLQDIAREEDPRFEKRSVAEHFHEGPEGVRDVWRWLEIYQRRLDPRHEFRFPEHHPRHRGFCLISHTSAERVLWSAFSDETWFRAPIAPRPDRASLVRALDELLDQRNGDR